MNNQQQSRRPPDIKENFIQVIGQRPPMPNNNLLPPFGMPPFGIPPPNSNLDNFNQMMNYPPPGDFMNAQMPPRFPMNPMEMMGNQFDNQQNLFREQEQEDRRNDYLAHNNRSNSSNSNRNYNNREDDYRRGRDNRDYDKEKSSSNSRDKDYESSSRRRRSRERSKERRSRDRSRERREDRRRRDRYKDR